MRKKSFTCPSALCEDGATLLGIVQKDGHVGFCSEPIVIDTQFVQIARKGRSPEKRFRFAQECRECSCPQWTGSRCSVIDEVISVLAPAEVSLRLPNCGIRSHCRWFSQWGARACTVCPEVITDTLTTG